MGLKMDRKICVALFITGVLFAACKNTGGVFEQLSSSHTNIKFENKPEEHKAFGILMAEVLPLAILTMMGCPIFILQQAIMAAINCI